MENCIFCQIVAGSIPSNKVFEDEKFLGFRDNAPTAPVHVLLIPKEHLLSNVGEADDTHAEMLGKMMVISRYIAEKEGISENFSVKTNSGKLAGQSVWHLHYHIKGGWKPETPITS